MCESRQTSSPHNRSDNRVWRHSAPLLFRPRPCPPPCASPSELYNFRATHAPCADRGPERLRVVARGRAHPPPCRHVDTCDHRAEPATFAAAELTTDTEWSVIGEPRQPILPPHMIQARLGRLRDGGSCVGTAAAPAVRGQGSSPPRLSRWRHLPTSRQPSASQRAGAGHRPPHAVRWSSLIFQLLVSYPCAENRLAQVLLYNSPQEAAPENDEAQSRSRGADSTRGSATADVAGSVHSQKETSDGAFPIRFATLEKLGAERCEIERPDVSKQSRDAKKIDAVLDLVGNSVMLDSLAMLRCGGRSCLAGWLGGLDPITDCNPLLQMASGVYLTFFGSFVFGTPGFPLFDVPRTGNGQRKKEKVT